MQELIKLSRAIDNVSTLVGRHVSWLIVVAAMVSAGNAIIRKVFDISSNGWLELQWWLFATVFLLASPWTLARNEHIRIDVVNHYFPEWMKNTVEVVGHVFFLIPSAAMLAWTSWHFFMTSWAQNEQSSNAGGLPQWPIKALIPLAFAFLLAQGISELIKRVAIIRGDLDEGERSSHHHHVVTSAKGKS